MGRRDSCQVMRFEDSKFRHILGGKKWLNGFGKVSNGRKSPRTPKVQVTMSRNMAGLVEWLSESNIKYAPVVLASFLIHSVF